MYVCLWYELKTVIVVSSQKKVKAIHSEAREVINHVNHQCKQETMEKSDFVYLLCR